MALSSSWFYGSWLQIIQSAVLFYFTFSALQHYTWTTLAALVLLGAVYRVSFTRFEKDMLAQDLETMRKVHPLLLNHPTLALLPTSHFQPRPRTHCATLLGKDLTLSQALAVLSTARERIDSLDTASEPALESIKLELDRVIITLCCILRPAL